MLTVPILPRLHIAISHSPSFLEISEPMYQTTQQCNHSLYVTTKRTTKILQFL